MRRYWVIFLFTMLLLSACTTGLKSQPGSFQAGGNSPEVDARTLTVFAASSLTDAFSEIGRKYELLHPGVIVNFNFAGSQALRVQLEQGAVADVFASADIDEMNALIMIDTLISKESPRYFISNSLIVILPSENPGKIKSLRYLSIPGVKLVLAAEEVPVGKYTYQALGNLNKLYGDGYREAVLENVVSYEDNVKQVVTKVELGEADAGIVYQSDAVSAPELERFAIPEMYNVIAQYPISQLIGAHEPELALEFIDFVLSDEGQAVLLSWGFTPIQP